MAQYIMEKMSDSMHGDGERLFPRLVNGQLIDTARMATAIEQRTSFTRGDVLGVLAEVAATVEAAMAKGDSVKIDGLGVLRPVLGLVAKDDRGEWRDSASRSTTGRNVRPKTVGFRPDASLMRSMQSGMSLERASDNMGRPQPTTTPDERAGMARQYIAAHGYMRVADYAELTGLAHSTATKELRRLVADEDSGIASSGARATKIYIAKQ